MATCSNNTRTAKARTRWTRTPPSPSLPLLPSNQAQENLGSQQVPTPFQFQSARIEKHGSMVNNSCIRNSETRTKSETLSKFNGEATSIKCMENAAKILSDWEHPAKIQPRTLRNKEIEWTNTQNAKMERTRRKDRSFPQRRKDDQKKS